MTDGIRTPIFAADTGSRRRLCLADRRARRVATPDRLFGRGPEGHILASEGHR